VWGGVKPLQPIESRGYTREIRSRSRVPDRKDKGQERRQTDIREDSDGAQSEQKQPSYGKTDMQTLAHRNLKKKL
jgi:hypothetical protein